MTSRILIVVATALLFLWIPAGVIAATPEPSLRTVRITADPGTIAATVSPVPVLITAGTQMGGVIRVDNTSALTEDVQIRTADYALDANGTPVAAASDFAFGSAAWYRFATPDFSLAGGSSRDIPFTLVIPADAAAGDHFAALRVIVTARPGQDGGAATGASARTVLVIESRLQHRVAGARPATPALDLTARPLGAAVRFTARVGNSGNTVLGHQADPVPTLVLYNTMPWGDPDVAERSLPVKGFYVAPESVRDVVVEWADMPLFGQYRAVFTLPAADGHPAVSAEATVSVMNVPVLAGAAGGTIVAVILLVWLVGRRRSVGRA